MALYKSKLSAGMRTYCPENICVCMCKKVRKICLLRRESDWEVKKRRGSLKLGIEGLCCFLCMIMHTQHRYISHGSDV